MGGCWGNNYYNNYYFIINKPVNAPCHEGGKGEDEDKVMPESLVGFDPSTTSPIIIVYGRAGCFTFVFL